MGSQKFDSCSLHSLGRHPMRADVSDSVGSRFRNLKVPRRQLQSAECNTGLQNTTGANFRSPNATQGCKTRQVRRTPISGPLSGPSGSPQSPAEPHPPSLAWVETPLPLGPLPLPPGPLNAKHSKRAQGAVFYGTHRHVRSEPSSPPPGSPLQAGGHRPGRGPPRPVPASHDKYCAFGAKLRAVPLAKSPPNFRPQAEDGAESDGRPLPTPPFTHLSFFSFFILCLDDAHKKGTLGAWHKRCKTKCLRGCV